MRDPTGVRRRTGCCYGVAVKSGTRANSSRRLQSMCRSM
jgi:hypothetical protein